MSGWATVPFEQLYAEPSRNGLNRPSRVRGSGFKMINMGELFAHDRIQNQPMELVPMNEVEQAKYNVLRGDLLFARQSLVASGTGKCSIVLSVRELTTFESHLIRVRLDQTKADPLFYYYYFSSPQGKGNVQSLVMQVAAAGIRGTELARLEVPGPDLETQRRIAAILSAYDDLIENNARRIAILEEMARNLYREWFVHFRFPGHEGVAMRETEMGLVPEGWQVVRYTDMVDVLSGGTPKTSISEYWDGNIPWFTPRDRPDSFYVLDTAKKITELGLSKCNSQLYPSSTVFITARGTVGECAIAATPMAMNQTCYALRGRNGLSQFLVFLQTLELVDALKTNATGAVFDAIVIETFRQRLILKPPRELMVRFNEIVSPIFETVKVLQTKQVNLRRTRDLLLPRLVSGELDVSELEIAGAAAPTVEA